jgi:hypothetical protein
MWPKELTQTANYYYYILDIIIIIIIIEKVFVPADSILYKL